MGWVLAARARRAPPWRPPAEAAGISTAIAAGEIVRRVRSALLPGAQ